MHFQSLLGQTKVVFDHQVKNSIQCLMISLRKFIIQLKTHLSRKLKSDERAEKIKIIIQKKSDDTRPTFLRPHG